MLTACIALIDALQDWSFFRRHGGRFHSTPGLQGAARWLTLFLGGIPFAIPFFTAVLGLVKGGEALLGYVRGHTRRKIAVGLGAALLLALVLGSDLPSLADQVARDEVSLWALGYCAAKVCAELFIVCLPVIASKARAEELAGKSGEKGMEPRR